MNKDPVNEDVHEEGPRRQSVMTAPANFRVGPETDPLPIRAHWIGKPRFKHVLVVIGMACGVVIAWFECNETFVDTRLWAWEVRSGVEARRGERLLWLPELGSLSASTPRCRSHDVCALGRQQCDGLEQLRADKEW